MMGHFSVIFEARRIVPYGFHPVKAASLSLDRMKSIWLYSSVLKNARKMVGGRPRRPVLRVSLSGPDRVRDVAFQAD